MHLHLNSCLIKNNKMSHEINAIYIFFSYQYNLVFDVGVPSRVNLNRLAASVTRFRFILEVKK